MHRRLVIVRIVLCRIGRTALRKNLTARIGLFDQFDASALLLRQGDTASRTDFVSVHVRYLTSALGTFRRNHTFYIIRLFNKYTSATGFWPGDSEVFLKGKSVTVSLVAAQFTGSPSFYETSVHD